MKNFVLDIAALLVVCLVVLPFFIGLGLSFLFDLHGWYMFLVILLCEVVTWVGVYWLIYR